MKRIMSKKFLLIIFVVMSCAYNEAGVIESRFDKKLIEHIPIKDIYPTSISISYPKDDFETNMGARFYYKTKLSPSSNNFASKFIQEIDPIFLKDECTIILPERNYINSIMGEPVLSKCSDINTAVPLPSFIHDLTDIDSTTVLNKLPFYVIQAQKGEYLHENLSIPTDKMPKEWNHGLTRGITIDSLNREIIFWVEMW